MSDFPDVVLIHLRFVRYLLSYDSVTYNSYLETLIASNSTAQGAAKQNQSPWLFMDAANTLFQSAKKRAYTITPKEKSKSSNTAGVEENEEDWEALREAERDSNGYPITHKKQSKWPEGVEPVLEELPKWRLLAETLHEIEREIAYGPEIDLSKFTHTRHKLLLTPPLQHPPLVMPSWYYATVTGLVLSCGSTFPPCNLSIPHRIIKQRTPDER